MLVNSSILSSPKAFWLGKWMGLRARALLQAGAGKGPANQSTGWAPAPPLLLRGSSSRPRLWVTAAWTAARPPGPAVGPPRLCYAEVCFGEGWGFGVTVRRTRARGGPRRGAWASGGSSRKAGLPALQGGLLLQGSQPLAPREDGWAGAGGRGRLGCRATRGASCQRVPELLVLKLSVPPTPPPSDLL